MSLLNTVCKHSQCSVEKVCEPLDLITCWPSFGSNKLNQTFSVVGDQTCTMVRRNIWPFIFTKLFQFSNIIFLGCLVWTAVLMSCHSISIRLRSGLWLGHSKRHIFFCRSCSVVDLLLCFGPLSCCITQLLLSFNWRTDSLTFSCKISW